HRAKAAAHRAGHQRHDRPADAGAEALGEVPDRDGNPEMTSTLRKSLVDVLMASGVERIEAATALAEKQNNGHSWTVEMLDSGKVDEQKFIANLGLAFHTPVSQFDLKSVDRSVLTLLPPRFVFKHHILPLT